MSSTRSSLSHPPSLPRRRCRLSLRFFLPLADTRAPSPFPTFSPKMRSSTLTPKSTISSIQTSRPKCFTPSLAIREPPTNMELSKVAPSVELIVFMNSRRRTTTEKRMVCLGRSWGRRRKIGGRRRKRNSCSTVRSSLCSPRTSKSWERENLTLDLVVLVNILINILLVASKGAAVVISNSISLLASLVDRYVFPLCFERVRREAGS